MSVPILRLFKNENSVRDQKQSGRSVLKPRRRDRTSQCRRGPSGPGFLKTQLPAREAHRALLNVSCILGNFIESIVKLSVVEKSSIRNTLDHFPTLKLKSSHKIFYL